MKRVHIISLFLLIFIMFGCTSEAKIVNPQNDKSDTEQSNKNITYFGEGEEWFSTYTISRVRTSVFESLYIQYITDRTASVEEQGTHGIGEIEYSLKIGDSSSLESSFPQPLKGVRNFHTATEINAELVNGDFPETIKLTIMWDEKKEMIELVKQD
ncbi:hypothetical protein ACFFHH_06585 [Cytobacillus solani]|uniref:Lipoprotein n=1 Tax=Cytobacillus solani TaxID=1637975 RepID=A0A0Q3VIC0_9BACI|nr:hypothetical protein [Cytobacillus solani]KOP82943.1 hypothetical protein AMS60_10965 [Bacillus sp. FJAT-21945]KQL19967.1 hypothetical protein AN957_16270 [Cytobacillus solani]USK53211.1 hypothetical protein LIS82_16510 [Cytobacillus solani]